MLDKVEKCNDMYWREARQNENKETFQATNSQEEEEKFSIRDKRN